MIKFLKDMTNEELWRLFPVIVSEYKAYWKEHYLSEKKSLEKVIGKNNIFR